MPTKIKGKWSRVRNTMTFTCPRCLTEQTACHVLFCDKLEEYFECEYCSKPLHVVPERRFGYRTGVMDTEVTNILKKGKGGMHDER